MKETTAQKIHKALQKALDCAYKAGYAAAKGGYMAEEINSNKARGYAHDVEMYASRRKR